MKHLVGFSGGIDSQACARWVLNRYPAEDVILINSNAGWNEHPATIAFVAEYAAKIHPVVSLTPILADMWKTAGYAEVRGFDSNEPLTFERMAAIKGRFPSRRAQFCTELLKIRPMLRWVRQNLGDEEFVRYSGVRRDESADRSDIPQGKVEVFNWVDEVVDWAHTDHGGYQFNILKGLHSKSCESKYGLCE